MTKIVLTRQLPPDGLALLRQKATQQNINLVEWKEDRSNGLLCMLNDSVDKELLDRAGPGLKVVSSMSAGFDHVQLDELKTRKIPLGTTPDALTDAVADLGAMLALMASRFGGEAMRAVLDGKWPSMPWSPLLLCGQPFRNKTYGFLGFGRIAQATLHRMLPYNPAKVLYTTSKIGKPASADYYDLIKTAKIPIEPATSIEQIAAESDVLFVCCALTPETKNLVNAGFLNRMKPTAVIVNTARGPIVDSDALAAALKDGKLLGAGLDVLTGEPAITADHPLVQEKRAVVLPHIGSATEDTRNLMSVQSVDNLFAGLEGKALPVGQIC